uniref:Transmembrane protein 170A n=1 Tax=Rhabditophanes sp. KR3021 TaxID=114890 RepID=A0AC35UCU5_9BILA
MNGTWVSFFPEGSNGSITNFSMWDVLTLDQTDVTEFYHMWISIFIWTAIIYTIVYITFFALSFIQLRTHKWLVFTILPVCLIMVVPPFIISMFTCAVIAFSFSAGGKAITAWHCLGIGCVQSIFSIVFSYTRLLATL